MKACPACKNSCADNARTCPKCGHTFTTGGGVLVAIVVAVVLAVALGLLR